MTVAARFLLLATLLLAGQAWAQESMLVLVDGRVIPYVGEYTMEGERLVFTSPTGERLFLAKDQVDLPETLRFREFVNEREARLAKARGEVDSSAPPAQSSLAEQVEAYNKDHPRDREVKQLVYEGKGKSTKRPEQWKELELPPFEDLGAQAISERAFRTAEHVHQSLEGEHDYLLYGFYAWVLIGVALAFASLATQLYLTVRSYSHGLRWGLLLSLLLILVVFATFRMILAPFLPYQVPNFIQPLTVLSFHLALLVYVFQRCYGRRLLFVVLLHGLIPYTLLSVGLIALIL